MPENQYSRKYEQKPISAHERRHYHNKGTRRSRKVWGEDAHPGMLLDYGNNLSKIEAAERKAARAAAKKGTGGTRRRHRKHRSTRRR